MKKTLLIMGLIPMLSITGFAQVSEEARQFDEVQREMSLGIHNIEKSLETYGEKKANEDIQLEAVLKENGETVANFQEAQTEYNVKKTDENFDKLQAQRRAVEKSDAAMLENLTNSILVDIEYVNQLSQDYFVLARQYAKFQALYSSMRGNSGDAVAMKAEIEKMQAQVKGSASLVIGLVDELKMENEDKDKLESTLTMLQNEFENSEILNTEGANVDAQFDLQVTLLKDAAAQMANYANVLELDKKKVALEALQSYQIAITSKFGDTNIVAKGIDPIQKIRDTRAKREARLSEYKRNKELANPTKTTPSGKVDHSRLRSIL